jgi:hypothetical protein
VESLTFHGKGEVTSISRAYFNKERSLQ